MPFEEYLGLLAKIDIAILNHKRQQAMGNITTLLGLGKKYILGIGMILRVGNSVLIMSLRCLKLAKILLMNYLLLYQSKINQKTLVM